MIATPDAIAPCQPVKRFDQCHAVHRLAIERYRYASLKADLQVSGFCRRPIGPGCPGVDLFRWLGPGIFQYPALDAPSPQVLIDRIRAGIRCLDGDTMLCRVRYFIVARHAPLAHRGNDFQVGRERVDRDIEAHLDIALACAAMCYRHRSLCPPPLDQPPSTHCPPHRSSPRTPSPSAV